MAGGHRGRGERIVSAAKVRKIDRSDGLVFEDPPPRKIGAGADIWFGLLEPLLGHKGRWCRVRGFDKSQQAYTAVQQLNRHNYRVPPGRFQFRSAAVEGRGYVYALYLGPEAEAAPK